MKLKSVEEHNKEVLRKTQDKYSTGVQCPHCGDEMKYMDDTLLLSYPPQKNVKCFNCNYVTRLYVKKGD